MKAATASAAPATKWHDGQITSVLRNRVKPLQQKYSALQKSQIRSIIHPVPRPTRGTFRDRHDTWGAGCDGRCWRQVISHQTKTLTAYGEVVWSWRRDRGVKPGRRYPAGDGGNKRRSPGRARNKP